MRYLAPSFPALLIDRVQGLTYWLKTQLFNFWASYKVVYSESFNFYLLGFWASKLTPSARCSLSGGRTDVLPRRVLELDSGTGTLDIHGLGFRV